MIAIIYLACIVAAEIITIFLNPYGGVIAHAVILFSLIIHSSLTSERPSHKLLLSLSLVPLLRIVNLSTLSTAISPVYYQYLIFYVPLLLAAIVVMRRLNYGTQEVGLTLRKIPIQMLVALFGLGFGLVEYLILKEPALISSFSLGQVLPAALILLVTT